MKACWIVAAVGWGTLAASLLPILNGGIGLWSLYLESFEVLLRLEASVFILATVMIFGIATVAVVASPLLLLAGYSKNPATRMLRWFGWATMLCLPVVAFLIARNGWWHGFVMLAIAHLLIGAAVVPWPGDKQQLGRGFEVLPQATAVDAKNTASPRV